MSRKEETRNRIEYHNPIDIISVGKSFKGKDVLINCTGKINWKDRIGLIGKNGSGKTSLLEILIGKTEPSLGVVTKHNASIGYLPQDINLENEKIREFVDSNKVLKEVGLNKSLATRVNKLSGGEKMKLSLARILMTDPNLLILDEPTNHLDIKARLWLEKFLKNYGGTIIVVSHDRNLLDKISKKIWSLENGILREYSGNYSFFIKQKALEERKAVEQYKSLQKEKKQLLRTIEHEQQRSAHSARKARSRKPGDLDRVRLGKYAETASRTAGRLHKQLKEEKEVLVEEIKEKKPKPKVSFRFPLRAAETGKRGKPLVELKGATLSYNHNFVVKSIELSILGGEKVGLFGENGSGKSTIVKAIMGSKEVKVSGMKIVSEGIRIGHVDQITRNLNPSESVLENVLPHLPNVPIQEVRAHLAKFLFMRNEEVNQLAGSLSGGEKIRLSLAQIAAINPHILILDEPINNLDLDSIEEVVSVLSSFSGTILAISHDLYFLSSIGISKAYLIENSKLIKMKYGPTDQEFEEELLLKMS